MRVQKTDWGYIEWMEYDRTASGQESALRVGKVHIDAGMIMLPHVHYEEQFVYVLEGHGTGYIDGKAQKFEPGAMFHMPAGCTHEFVNGSDGPMVHLLVSSPIPIDPDSLIDKTGPARTGQISEDFLYRAIDAVRTQFLDNIHVAFVIRDMQGHIAAKSDAFPSFCSSTCGILSETACPCLQMDINTHEAAENTYVCPYGMTIFQVPILWEERCLGIVQGGYIRQSYRQDSHTEVYDTPDSNAFGLLQLLRKIAKAIRNYCEFDQYRRELFQKEASLEGSLRTQRALQAHLRDTEHTVTNLKINNHFLFNTLNSMASMALEGGMRPLYQSIIDLSKMLRYSVRIQGSQIRLSTEIEYLEAYLKLQKLRYQEDLTFEIRADEHLTDALVPFNFLQPIVENAFTHGFSQEKKKHVRMSCTLLPGKSSDSDDHLQIILENNGETITPERSRQLQMQMKSSSSHGLSMVYEKMRTAFGENFSMSIGPGDPDGARIIIEIPYHPAEQETNRRNPHDQSIDM